MKSLKSLGLALAAVLLLAGVLSAQAPTAGRIIGTILDDQGAPIPGVSVQAKSPRLVGTAATVSDVNGAYRLLALPPGTYTITCTLQGFSDIVRNDIVLGVEQALVVDIAMKPSTIQEEVVVIGQAPLIDVKSAARGPNAHPTAATAPRSSNGSSSSSNHRAMGLRTERCRVSSPPTANDQAGVPL